MIISLLGYMGSGKSHISRTLAQKINFKLFDLDKEISLPYRKGHSHNFQRNGGNWF